MQGIVADVPYEVWRNITSFLTSQEVKNLYSVNRPLFLIAMEERYRCAYIGNLDDARTIRSFQRLIDQVPLQYVRELHICPFLLVQLPVQTSPRRITWWEGFSNSFEATTSSPRMQDFPKNHIQPFAQPEAKATVLAILANMTSVMKYHIQCDKIGYSLNAGAALPYISAAWSSFGSNLRHLQLSVPLELIPSIIGFIRLDNLEELVINMSVTHDNTDYLHIIHFTLLDFINNHGEKLKIFALISSQRLDLYLVLHKIVPMPLLESFSFSDAYYITHEQKDLGGLRNFLWVNSGQLKKLDLQFYSFYSQFSSDHRWFKQPCFQVPFPRLESLTIKIHRRCNDIVGGVADYVHRFNGSLTSLDLNTGDFLLGEVKRLVHGLSGKSNFWRLAFAIADLSHELFHFLAHNLPQLEDLSIEFPKAVFREYDDVSGSYSGFTQFWKEFRGADNWKLRNLNLISRPSYDLDRTCRRAVARAFPMVVTFNGISRGKYLS